MGTTDIKAVVRRFNEEVIARGDRAAFDALVAPGFVNRSAPPGAADGRDALWDTFSKILRPALTGLSVTIHDQVAEGNVVTTRKTITGTHSGPLLGAEPTGRPLSIDVIDMVRVEAGSYVEHWGINTLQTVVVQLKAR